MIVTIVLAFRKRFKRIACGFLPVDRKMLKAQRKEVRGDESESVKGGKEKDKAKS